MTNGKLTVAKFLLESAKTLKHDQLAVGLHLEKSKIPAIIASTGASVLMFYVYLFCSEQAYLAWDSYQKLKEHLMQSHQAISLDGFPSLLYEMEMMIPAYVGGFLSCFFLGWAIQRFFLALHYEH